LRRWALTMGAAGALLLISDFLPYLTTDGFLTAEPRTKGAGTFFGVLVLGAAALAYFGKFPRAAAIAVLVIAAFEGLSTLGILIGGMVGVDVGFGIRETYGPGIGMILAFVAVAGAVAAAVMILVLKSRQRRLLRSPWAASGPIS
jgi:hypothetical protein